MPPLTVFVLGSGARVSDLDISFCSLHIGSVLRPFLVASGGFFDDPFLVAAECVFVVA